MAVASSKSFAKPIMQAAVPRIFSSSALTSALEFISSGSSVPFMPISSARTNTMGLDTSRMLASIFPKPGISSTSSTFPVGRSLPVLEPAGFKKFTFSSAAVPSTPAIWQSPSWAKVPVCGSMGTVTLMYLSVLRLSIRTVVMGCVIVRSPSSTAKGPTAAVMLPQLDL